MVEGPYRDALAAVRERVLGLKAEVERRDARVTEVDLALVPDDLATRVDELRVRAAGQPEPTLAGWTALEGALEELSETLSRVESLAPELALALDAPMPASSKDPRPFLIEEPRHDQLKKHVEDELGAQARGLERERWADDDYVWSFELERVALTLHGRAFLAPVSEQSDAELTLYAGMPPELGPLAVAPAELWHRTPAHAPDPEFARRFHVRGEPRLARALLTGRLRAHLVALHPRRPRLRIAEGVAALSWQVPDIVYDDPTFGLLDGARALVAIRHALE